LSTSQLALFGGSGRPQGLHYRPDFVSPAQESELIAHIQALPLAPFQFGQFEGKRRVVSFGHRYDFSTQRLEGADPIPGWLTPVVREVERADKLPDGSIGHVLVTEYEAGTGIGWHRDKKHFDKVFGLSLASACDFRFRKKNGTKWTRYTLHAGARSLYTITGESRHDWEHSIQAVPDRRYSITFRTMAGSHASR
jgi:alkylated DNA repair dioxygenase AlkB